MSKPNQSLSTGRRENLGTRLGTGLGHQDYQHGHRVTVLGYQHEERASFEKGLYVNRNISGIDLRLSNTTGILPQKTVWFAGVKAKHETRFNNLF